MSSAGQQVVRDEGILASRAAYSRAETGPEYPQASYYRARYYDATTGRFISEDPLEFEGDTVDFYGYAYNNSTSFTDPFGLQGAGTATAPAPAPPVTNPPSAPPVKAPPIATPEPPLPTPQPGPGWWPGLGAILSRGGILAGLQLTIFAPSTARDEDLLPKPKTPPPCDKNEPNCTKATPFHLDGAGISDPHEFKKDFLGKKAPISRYDICACKDGSIVIKLQGQCGSPGPGIETGYKWK